MGDNMKTYYIRGLAKTILADNDIKTKFIKNDISSTFLIDDYTIYTNKSKEEIISDLCSKIDTTDDINIVCHSMGCNFGILLANRLDNVKSIVFVSPEFEDVTREEKKLIEPSINSEEVDYGNDISFLDKLKSIKLFLKSKKWIKDELDLFKNRNITTSIIYSKGDKFVSRRIINELSELDNINSYMIDSNSHNPLLENNECMDIIVDTINGRHK